MDLRANSEALLNPIDESGDWIASEQLRDLAMGALDKDADVRVPLGSTEYLDAGALQILLALSSELKAKGRALTITEPSAALRSWFVYAGAEELLPAESGSLSAPVEAAGR